MLQNRYTEVMSNLQNTQDLLADKLGLFLVLIDENHAEITLPSRLPLVCYENAEDSRCKQCLAKAIDSVLQSKEEKNIVACHNNLYFGVIKTSIISDSSIYLVYGRSQFSEYLHNQLHLLQAIYNMPIILKNPHTGEAPYVPRSYESYGLTRQEFVILSYMVAGLSNKDIAGKLSIALCTVKTHIIHILKKLSAKNRTEASILAIREGLIKK